MRTISPLNSRSWTSQSNRSLLPDLMDSLMGDFDRMVSGFSRTDDLSDNTFVPYCDVRETKDHFLISFDVPGVKKEDVKIELSNNQLIISGERHHEAEVTDDETVIRKERAYGKFQKTFSLPNSVDVEKIEAQHEDGVLNVAIPKTENAKSRTIQIQSGSPGGFIGKILGSGSKSSKAEKFERAANNMNRTY